MTKNGEARNEAGRDQPYSRATAPASSPGNVGGHAGSQSAPVLAYHQVVVEPSAYVYAVTAAQLDEHLQILRQWCEGSSDRTKAAQVTFDDGHISNYSYALPVLQKHLQKAHFFIAASWTGVNEEYMNWQQLRDLVALGHTVGSHGWSHVALTHCTRDQAREELRRSKFVLEDQLGAPVESISFPHGRWNAALVALCGELGYRHVYTSDAWMPTRRQDGITLYGRWMVRSRVHARQLQRLLALGGTGRAMRRGAYASKEIVRRMLGDEVYHRLWRVVAGAPNSMS